LNAFVSKVFVSISIENHLLIISTDIYLFNSIAHHQRTNTIGLEELGSITPTVLTFYHLLTFMPSKVSGIKLKSEV